MSPKPRFFAQYSKRRQKGQAAFIAIVFCLLSVLALFAAFNAWQLTNAKIKLGNTADAVAYSASIMQARDYNFSAYVNRAMVANQLTVAQLVSLRSWADALAAAYGATPDNPASDFLDEIAQTYAADPETWTEPKSMGASVLGGADEAIMGIAENGVLGVDIVDHVLSEAAMFYHASTMLSTPLLAQQVAQDNEPNSYVDGAYFLGRGAGMAVSWALFSRGEAIPQTQLPNSGPLAQKASTAIRTLLKANELPSSVLTIPGAEYLPSSGRFASVQTDSQTLDNFVTSRASPLLPFLAGEMSEEGCPDGWGIIALSMEHAGGTNLQLDGWQALDATQANGFWLCMIKGVIPDLQVLVVDAGSGGAANGNGDVYHSYLNTTPGFQDLPGGGIVAPGLGNLNLFGQALFNPLTALSGLTRLDLGPGVSLDGPYAGSQNNNSNLADPPPSSNLDNRAGLLPYQDLFSLPTPSGGQDDSFNRCPTLTFEVSRAITSVATTSFTLASRYNLAVDAPNGLMRALSSASCYFIRPNESSSTAAAGALPSNAGWQRADGQVEYPNMFNPYWQSSLVSTSSDVSASARQALVSGTP